MAFNGCLLVANMDDELSVMNKKISLLRIPVCSKYTEVCLNRSLLRLTLISNYLAMRGTIILAIMIESVQV